MSQDQKSTSISFPAVRRPTRESREDQVPAIWHAGDVILNLYEVKDVFWPGATGLVYRVHHREWNLDLAVKSPRETPFETEEQLQNFVEAADGWIGLGLFPHIVSCYYARKLGGIPRLFLEFVEGESLHEWIQTRRLYDAGPVRKDVPSDRCSRQILLRLLDEIVGPAQPRYHPGELLRRTA